jgi:hypothetical protein
MASHLTLPWLWKECLYGERCGRIAHVDEDEDVLNSYPQEWVVAMLGNCEITSEHFVWLNDQGEYHRENGPAMLTTAGTHVWYTNGQSTGWNKRPFS